MVRRLGIVLLARESLVRHGLTKMVLSRMASTSCSINDHLSPQPNWLDLPPELTASILCRLNIKDKFRVIPMVCMTWHNACKDPLVWWSIDMYNLLCTPSDIAERMCCYAVDRSCGCLDNITLCNAFTAELLYYILDRAPLLRSLRLSNCTFLYDFYLPPWRGRSVYSHLRCRVKKSYLTEVTKKLPNLEELHIFGTRISKEVMESFGHSCTQLKSFTFTRPMGETYPAGDTGDEIAKAIAQTMSGLRHLRLCKNRMTNDGLQDILNGCPHLESLDLRRCFNLNLEGDLGTTCAEQIKDLKLPDDPFEGLKYIRIMNDRCWNDSSDEEVSTSSEDKISTSSNN